jgi:hypothetical protein
MRRRSRTQKSVTHRISGIQILRMSFISNTGNRKLAKAFTKWYNSTLNYSKHSILQLSLPLGVETLLDRVSTKNRVVEV